MAFYKNTRQLYVCAEQLFRRIQEEDPKAGDALLASRLVIRLRCTEPDGVILINGRSRPSTPVLAQTALTQTWISN